MDIRRIYEYALQREHEGKRFFEENAERMQHAAAAEAFRQLAAEEQKHINFIQTELDRLNAGGPPAAPATDLEAEGFFSQRAAGEAIDQTTLEAMVPDLPVLRMAYLIERDFAEFYERAAAQAEGEARTALETLARWERVHELLFKTMHDQAFDLYAGMPWGG